MMDTDDGYGRDVFDSLYFAAGAGIWAESWLNGVGAFLLALFVTTGMRFLRPRVERLLFKGAIR